MHKSLTGEINADPRKRRYRRFLVLFLILDVIGIFLFSYYILNKAIPDKIRILVDKSQNFNLKIPIQAEIESDDVTVSQIAKSNVPAGQMHIDLNKPFQLQANKTGSYKVNLKLFGWLSIKNISLDVIDTIEVIPCGGTIGITLETDGILVLGTAEVMSKDGMNYEPALNILKTGDYIMEANNQSLSSKEELIQIIQSCDGQPVSLKVKRDSEYVTLKVQPVATATGEYKIGTWIRDDTQGIGTLTFVTTTGDYGALGHGITDVDTGLLMSVKTGGVYDAEVVNIIKGKAGQPGELSGVIHENSLSKIGSITKNTPQGIFGQIVNTSDIYKRVSNNIYNSPIPIALKQEIKTGDATILCNVEGQIKEYKISIENIDFGNKTHSKGLVIKITDERLKELTGGIVQGMSGSPIIQNGKLVGAVTHVFIRDASMGYGTFIENMLEIIQQ
ncbi:SpoIVB peptidase [Lachnoclostridium phytofermentans]|uniref:Stage IV sporulation protein B n=1 Tax=Lachnoclostridium phytofermentans (strain ATCC 700394 / DSM 18823 / ISDg) TaxID=357809 RepID=A9KMA5_LACP7|nr:SpoIVB peptidase [Lachnoclostridium phytofermentans]ABX42859.1 stage IV sporulation protein B [Lachnoclostridium phytofermentans ISDg]